MNIKRVLLLTKVASKGYTFWNQFAIPVQKTGRNKKQSAALKIFLTILIAIALMSVVAIFLVMLGFNYLQVEVMGTFAKIEGAGMFTAALVAFLLTLIFSFMSAPSAMYHGKDMPLLVTLPIERDELYTSRLILHYRANAPLYWFLLIPGVVVTAISYGITIRMVFTTVLLLVCGPMLPIVLSATATQLVIARSQGGGKRVRSEFLASMLLILLLLIAQGLASRWLRSGMDSSTLQAISLSVGKILRMAMKVLFLFAWQGRALISSESVAPLVLSLLFVGIALWPLVVCGTRTFPLAVSKALEGDSSVRSRRRKSRSTPAQSSVVWTLCKKEFSVINSASAFMMELYAEAAIPLVLILVYAITGSLRDISAVVAVFTTLPQFPLLLCGILLLMGSISMMSGTSVSREGEHLTMMRVLPIPPSKHLQAKVLAHMLLFFLPYSLYCVLALIWFHLIGLHLLWMVPLGAVIIATSSCFGLTVDFNKPRLDWQNPQQAVKQNMNGLMAMGLSVATIAVCAGAGYLLAFLLGWSIGLTGLTLIALAIVELTIAWNLALKSAQQCYAPQ
ncbi:MAG: hypothetical protein PHS67_04930 [Sphaerochaetaceae bacterium]|nr:hypothetical protein [Sphaerochaetaceae bacterium]